MVEPTTYMREALLSLATIALRENDESDGGEYDIGNAFFDLVCIAREEGESGDELPGIWNGRPTIEEAIHEALALVGLSLKENNA